MDRPDCHAQTRRVVSVYLASLADAAPPPGALALAPISMQRIVPPLRLAEPEAEASVLPPGDGGVGAQVGLAQDG